VLLVSKGQPALMGPVMIQGLSAGHGRDTSDKLLSWADGMRRCVGSTGTGAVARHVGQMETAMGMHVCFLCCKAPQAWKFEVQKKLGPGSAEKVGALPMETSRGTKISCFLCHPSYNML